MKQVITRLQSPTPKFFQKLRNIGLTIAGIGAAVIAVPLKLPSLVVQIVEYLTVAGTVMSGVSQTAVLKEKE